MTLSSPFEELHKKFKASFAHYHNWNLPSDYGNTEAELDAVYNSCALFDLSAFGRIEISGTGTNDFLEFIIPQSLKSLKTDNTTTTFICDINGILIDIVRVIKTNKYTLVLTTPSKRETVLKVIQQAAQIRTFNIQIIDKTTATAMIGFYGPKAFELLKSKFPIDISDIECGQVKEVSMFVFSATLIRSSWLGVEGVELICNASLSSMATFAVGKLQDNGAIRPAGMEALNCAFVEASLPLSIECRYEKHKISPVSLNLMKKVDFSKDFISKNALQNLDSKNFYIAVGIKAKIVNAACKGLNLQYDERDIGHSDLLFFSQRLGSAAGIAFVEPAFSAITDNIQLVNSEVVLAAEMVKLPFNDSIASTIYK